MEGPVAHGLDCTGGCCVPVLRYRDMLRRVQGEPTALRPTAANGHVSTPVTAVPSYAVTPPTS